MTNTLQQVPGWSVCRKFQEFPVPHVDVLTGWAERGRLRPDDYIVNMRLEVCFQAQDVPELQAIFRRLRRAPLVRVLRILGLSLS